jgi:hypothetical protein
MLALPEFPHNLWKVFSDFSSAAPRSGGVRFLAAREWFSWLRPAFQQGLSLAELGFVGSLAWRAAGREGVLSLQKSRILTGETLDKVLPQVRDLHNIVLSGDNVVKFPSLTEEEELVFGREVVAWKWTLARNVRISRKTAKLRFFLTLHSARYSEVYDPGVRECGFVHDPPSWYPRRPPEVVDWMGVYKEAYLRPRPVVTGSKLYFDYLDRLPSYEECGGVQGGTYPVHSVQDKICEARLAHGLTVSEKPVFPAANWGFFESPVCLDGGPLGRCSCHECGLGSAA